MRIFKYLCLVLLITQLVFSNCSKDPDDIESPKYLVSAELYQPVVPYDILAAKSMLTLSGMGELANLVSYNFTVYKLTYKTAFENDTIIASGIVSIPTALEKKETFPLLSYQHQTIVQKNKAPSVNIDQEMMTYLASTGMVILIPDYIGFGASKNVFHPYLHKEYTNNAVLDFIRAAKEFIATEEPCKINEKLFLFGYSQGGGATLGALSAIENEPRNSDLTVLATSCGSGAYDLNEMCKWLVKQARYDSPYMLAYMLESFTAYSDLDIDYSLIFNPEIGVKIPGIIDGIVSESYINTTIGTTHVGEMLNDDFEDEETYETNDDYASLRQAFDENRIDAWPIKSSLALYYGSADATIPGYQSISIYKNFEALNVGAKVRLYPQNDKDHYQTFPPTLVETVKWFKSL